MWIKAYVSLTAIQSGMYMDRLDTKQSIALCLVDLAKGFEARNKEKLPTREIDQFMQNCVDLALQTAPDLITARLLQVELHKREFERTHNKIIYKQLENNITKLFADGYLELPELMYSEQPKTAGLDSTYTPFAQENIREGTPTGKGTVLTLSNGRYAEFKNAKRIETIGSVRFDTERKKIVGFGENKREVEVVSRFLSVDPLARSYPWYTPYQFAGNKVIMAVDLDGLEESAAISLGADTHYRADWLRKMTQRDIFSSLQTHVKKFDADETMDNKQVQKQFFTYLKDVSDKDVSGLGIGFVAVFSHGIAGNIYGATNSDGDRGWDGGLRNSTIITASVSGIKLAKGACIYLGGCNAGSEARENNCSLAQELADKFPDAFVVAMVNDGVGPQNENLVTCDLDYIAKMGKNSKGDFMIFQAGQAPLVLGKQIDLMELHRNVISSIIIKNTPILQSKGFAEMPQAPIEKPALQIPPIK